MIVVLIKILDIDRDSITFNDQSQSLIQAGTVFQTSLAWISDVPTGSVILGQSAQITSQSLEDRAFVSNLGKDHAQYDATHGGQIRINDQIMSTIAGELVTTTASTGTSINFAGQSQWVADGKLDVAETGQTGDYHHLQRVAQEPSSVARTFQKTLPDGSTITLEVRESLLSGPDGFLKLESTWEILADGKRRLSTIIPFGG